MKKVLLIISVLFTVIGFLRKTLMNYDAFAPSTQPEVWEKTVIEKIYSHMQNGAILVTFCAKGEFKRTLKAIGFAVETLKGPPGKREITRAIK